MFAVHEVLDLSDAMGGIPAGQRPPSALELFYNYAMVVAFFAGIAGYAVHACALMNRGIAWLVLKAGVLLAGWYLLLVIFE